MQFVTKKHEIVFSCMHLFLHANFILVYSFPAVCSISDGQWCNKKSMFLCCSDSPLSGMNIFDSLFIFFVVFDVRFALQPSKIPATKHATKKYCLTLNHSFFPLWFCRISTAHMLAVSLCCLACCISRQGH